MLHLVQHWTLFLMLTMFFYAMLMTYNLSQQVVMKVGDWGVVCVCCSTLHWLL